MITVHGGCPAARQASGTTPLQGGCIAVAGTVSTWLAWGSCCVACTRSVLHPAVCGDAVRSVSQNVESWLRRSGSAFSVDWGGTGARLGTSCVGIRCCCCCVVSDCRGGRPVYFGVVVGPERAVLSGPIMEPWGQAACLATAYMSRCAALWRLSVLMRPCCVPREGDMREGDVCVCVHIGWCQ